jgi:O-antigen ligase
MTIGLILIAGFIKNKIDTGSFFNNRIRNFYLAACAFFFLLQITALAYTNDIPAAWNHIQVKSALVFIPLCFYCCTYLTPYRFGKLMTAFVFTLAITIAWCLVTAFIKYRFHHESVTVFFYHSLVSSLGHNAVQFSILVFVGLIYLLQTADEGIYVFNKAIHFILVAYFIGALLLLSSKLVIIFMAGYLFFYLFTTIKKKTNTRFTIAIAATIGFLFCSIIFFTNNPVSDRFKDIMHGNINVVEQSSFTPANYFNGVQFRLLQWRFVKEILHDNKAWLLGISPGDAQNLLNQKYIATHMYTGDPRRAGMGYLGYNTHNQFLESLLQTGVIGLLCFMAICFEMIKMAIRQKKQLLWAIVLLLIAYAFNESVFETQYGLVIFIFLPLFFYSGAEKEVSH